MVDVLSQSKSPWRKTRVPRYSALPLRDRHMMLGKGLAGNHPALRPCMCGERLDVVLERVGCSAGLSGNQMSMGFLSQFRKKSGASHRLVGI